MINRMNIMSIKKGYKCFGWFYFCWITLPWLSFPLMRHHTTIHSYLLKFKISKFVGRTVLRHFRRYLSHSTSKPFSYKQGSYHYLFCLVSSSPIEQFCLACWQNAVEPPELLNKPMPKAKVLKMSSLLILMSPVLLDSCFLVKCDGNLVYEVNLGNEDDVRVSATGLNDGRSEIDRELLKLFGTREKSNASRENLKY
jgi:hypothetical protein